MGTEKNCGRILWAAHCGVLGIGRRRTANQSRRFAWALADYLPIGGRRRADGGPGSAVWVLQIVRRLGCAVQCRGPMR